MRKTIRIHDIHLFEQDVLQEYFHAMALKGWMVKKVKRLHCTFEKCPPQDVYFFFDVYEKGNILDFRDVGEEQKQYGELVEQYDYELICQTSNYQVFLMKQPPVIDLRTLEDEERNKKYARTIYKYEGYYFLLSMLCTIYLICTLPWRSTKLLSNPLNLLAFPFLIILLTSSFIRCIPFLRWIRKKDAYAICKVVPMSRTNV